MLKNNIIAKNRGSKNVSSLTVIKVIRMINEKIIRALLNQQTTIVGSRGNNIIQNLIMVDDQAYQLSKLLSLNANKTHYWGINVCNMDK